MVDAYMTKRPNPETLLERQFETLVKKVLLQQGSGEVKHASGTKLTFHIKSELLPLKDEETNSSSHKPTKDKGTGCPFAAARRAALEAGAAGHTKDCPVAGAHKNKTTKSPAGTNVSNKEESKFPMTSVLKQCPASEVIGTEAKETSHNQLTEAKTCPVTGESEAKTCLVTGGTEAKTCPVSGESKAKTCPVSGAFDSQKCPVSGPAATGMVIDDSKVWGREVVLILGKQFKLEVWEACLKTMACGEVAEFTVDKVLLANYPTVSKALREAYGGAKQQKKKTHSCCGMSLKHGLGHPDLDYLVNNPVDMKFTMELVKAEPDGTYEKDYWAMDEDEQISSIPVLQEEGNKLYKAGAYEKAAEKYTEAIGRVDQLMWREKPGDEEWVKLNDQKCTLLLNYSQCQLVAGQYYSVIEHCSTVLEHHPENVKALFRRGKAYVEVFSPTEAKADLTKASKMDPNTAPACRKLLTRLQDEVKKKYVNDKTMYSKMFANG